MNSGGLSVEVSRLSGSRRLWIQGMHFRGLGSVEDVMDSVLLGVEGSRFVASFCSGIRAVWACEKALKQSYGSSNVEL